ncbi:expressed unknown protein [Seminavis robusta]|uniref:Uncharacterized protein n=1 Tax=Seminavis robusta TaxID=568900 RepID=A0A9N8EDP8_9STRA|nr:expressed unknown protein [Seminavis robusta]|eukprot:Sro792_g203180.1 n/a (920) ;mRNA; f:41269-44028
MPSSSGDGNNNSSSKGGLSLSRHGKGIQNTRRSVRGIGGGNHGSSKRMSLGEELSRIDSKRGGGSNTSPFGGGGGGGRKPTIADDLSIDETFVSASDPQQQGGNKSATNNGESPKSVLLESASSTTGDSSKNQDSAANKIFEISEKVAAIKSKRLFNKKAPVRRANTFHGTPRGRGGMDDLSRSEHVVDRSPPPPKEDELGLSRSEHAPRSSTSMRKTAAKAQAPSIQGIYKIIDSMDTTTNVSNTTVAPNSNNSSHGRRLPRRTRTAGGNLEGSNRLGSSMRGIKNLLDNSKHGGLDGSKHNGMANDGSGKEKMAASGDDSQENNNAGADDDDNNNNKKDDFGTNHSRSLQGIQKLIGTMNKDKEGAPPSSSSKEKKSTPPDPPKRSSRSSRRLVGRQDSLGRKAEEVPPAKKMSANEDDRRRRSSSEAKKNDNNKMPTLDLDDENDYDSVATPKTASEPPPPPQKDAPPPPQRRNVARRPRNNNVPSLAPHKPAATASHKSAPAKVPATPLRSSPAVVDPAATPIVSSTPQQLTTPLQATMPVMPNADFDSLATPSSAGKPSAPPMVSQLAPPPPPKRNMDPRWKQQRGGQIMPMATPGQAPKAPVMTMISPGGIVIEVNSSKQQTNKKRDTAIPEPMTPASASQMTPGGRHRNNNNVLQTPASIRSRKSHDGDHSYLNTPSVHSMGDISELTPCTTYGYARGGGETPRSQTVPRTPSLYQSPGGVISELTPGGYSVGLLGDDDYQGSEEKDATMTPSIPSRGGFMSELTSGTFSILLEEQSEDDGADMTPSTPSLHSPAGVVSELTPGTYGTATYGISTIGEDSSGGSRSNIAPVPSTPSLHKDSGIVNTSSVPIPITPTIHSPAGIVSELSGGSEPSFHSRGRNNTGLSNLSGHSGVVSELTYSQASGSTGQVVG